MHRRFMAFDRHMNLVLGDAEEFRKLPPKKGIPEDEVSVAPMQSCCRGGRESRGGQGDGGQPRV